MSELNEKLKELISAEQIKQKPKWRFLLKNWLFWAFFGVAVLFGALSLAVVLEHYRADDLLMLKGLNKSFTDYFFLTVPYFWLVSFAGFILLSWYNLRHVEGGYRINPWLAALLNLLVSLLLGVALFSFGVGELVSETIDREPAFRCFNQRVLVWENPEEGMLAGKVVKVAKQGLVVISFAGREWLVDTSEVELGFEIKVGLEVRIIGEQTGQGSFEAHDIRPWFGPGQSGSGVLRRVR